ncbi:MAG: hypothetical protein ACHQ52_07130 [Candidatus Eisenbacteria bacterium]
MSDSDPTNSVIAALEDARYLWRTLDGLARQTGLPREQVLAVLERSADRVVRARATAPGGAALYTTREHYLRRASPGQKLAAALRNRLS